MGLNRKMFLEKRIFSFLAPDERDKSPLGYDTALVKRSFRSELVE